MSSPKISVIMSVYNGQKYLREAVESILNQVFKNFEFIIINDGSTDKTSKVLKEYAKKDERIKIITNPENIGLTKSLNKGIKISRGEYIARMDADDISLPERFRKQIEFLGKNPSFALCGCFIKYIDENSKIIGQKSFPILFKKIKQKIIYQNPFIHSALFFRKDVLNEIGFYNENFYYAQDYELILRMTKKYQVTNLDKFLLLFRISKNSISWEKRKNQDVFALQSKLKAIKEYDYPKYMYIYLWRGILGPLIPSKLKFFKQSLMLKMMNLLKKILINFPFLTTKIKHFDSLSMINLIKYFVFPKKEKVNYQPLGITCYVTDRCNLNCDFCPHHSRYRNKNYLFLHPSLKDMPFETFKKIVLLFPATKRITLAGVGEPLLNKDIYKMIDYAIKKKKIVTMISNGTLLKEHIDELIKRKIFSLSISLNVKNQVEFYNLTGNERHNFIETVSNLQKFIARNRNQIKLDLTFVVSKKNIFEIDKILRFIKDKLPEVSKVMFHSVLYFGIDQKYPLSNLLYEDNLEIVQYINQIKKQSKNFSFQIIWPKLKKKEGKIFCNDFFEQLHIDAEGNVSGCGRAIAPQKEFGNIFKENQNVWNNSFFQEMRKMSLRKRFDQHPVCKNCMGS